MPVTIREALPADAAMIADISRQTFYETFAAVNTQANMDKFMNEQFAAETLMKEVYDPANFFFLAFDENRPVGYIKMKENDDAPELQGEQGVIEIVRLYAIADAIGKGVGKQLMQHCINVAKNRHKKIIWLGVWEKNEKAIAFYNKWGFEKFGTHIFLLGDDPQTDWLMKKHI